MILALISRNFHHLRRFSIAGLLALILAVCAGFGLRFCQSQFQRGFPPVPNTSRVFAPSNVAKSAPEVVIDGSVSQPIPGYRRSFDPLLHAPAIMTGDPELDPLISYLKASFAAAIKDGRLLVINDKTNVEALHFRQPYQHLADDLLSQASDQVPTEIIQDFIEKNRESNAVEHELLHHLPCNLLSADDHKAIFSNFLSDEGWKRFHAKFPRAFGIITISRVGLNRDRTLAFFYVGVSQSSLSGQGQIHVLKKNGNVWIELPIEIFPSWFAWEGKRGIKGDIARIDNCPRGIKGDIARGRKGGHSANRRLFDVILLPRRLSIRAMYPFLPRRVVISSIRASKSV